MGFGHTDVDICDIAARISRIAQYSRIATPAVLRTLSAPTNGTFVYVATCADALPHVFQYSAASVVADDGINSIKPAATTTGRYLQADNTFHSGGASASHTHTELNSLRLTSLAGTVTRHVVADPDGDLLNTECWDDLVTPATLINLAGPAAPPAYNATEMTIDFSASADNTIQMVFQMPHAWKEGQTTCGFHVHWKPSTAGAGNVVWEWKYRWVSNEAVTGAWNTSSATEAASGVLNKVVRGAEKTISGAGQTISSLLQIQLQRLAGSDANDTYGGLAQVLSVDLHYLKDAPGSVALGSKTG